MLPVTCLQDLFFRFSAGCLLVSQPRAQAGEGAGNGYTRASRGFPGGRDAGRGLGEKSEG